VFLYSKDLREGTQPGKNIQIQEILNQVQEVAANIEDKKKRGSILSHLAKLQARTGNAAIALATASTIPNDWQREHALMLIGWGQTEIGDTKGARKTATLIKNDSLRNQALAHLARWQAAAGEVDDALDTAHAVTNPARRGAVLASIALVRALRGDWVSADNYFEQAVQAAATVQNDSTKIRALLEIAELQVLARNRIGAARTLDQAEAALAEMGSNAVGDSLRAELAQIQAKAGLVGEAFRTKHEITEERMQRRALGSIAKTQAELDMVAADQAENWDRWRRGEYPNIGDQLDAIWKQLNQDRLGGKALIQEADDRLNEILAVKAKYPKPAS